MALIPVDSSLLKCALDEFTRLLASLVGPSGNQCLLTSSVNCLTLTSSSSRLIPNLSFRNPFFQFALECIRSQTGRYGDGGLYCGILLNSLLAHIVESPVLQLTICNILAELGRIVQSEFQNSTVLRIQFTLDSIQPLLTVGQSVLHSKNSIIDVKDRNVQSYPDAQVSLLVKAFLQSEASFDNVLLNIQEKSGEQGLFSGVLYESTEEEYRVVQNMSWDSVSILLFSVMLSDRIDCSEKEYPDIEYEKKGKAQLQAAQLFMHKAMSFGIRVIACQKVVHPTLLLELRRKGILVLQRLGKHMTELVEKLSGAIRIASLNLSFLESLSNLKGHLRKVQHMHRCGKNFVHLEGSENSKICSLLLTSRCLESKDELKVVAHQVLVALKQVVLDKVVCPGAGCSEVFLCFSLSSAVKKNRKVLCEKLNCGTSELDYVLKCLQVGLLAAARLDSRSGKLVTDSIYHHAWKGSDGKESIVAAATCNCGLVKASSVSKLNGEWMIVTPANSDFCFCVADDVDEAPPLSLCSSSVIDLLSTKKSAIDLALDSCMAISNIGAIITRSE